MSHSAGSLSLDAAATTLATVTSRPAAGALGADRSPRPPSDDLSGITLFSGRGSLDETRGNSRTRWKALTAY